MNGRSARPMIAALGIAPVIVATVGLFAAFTLPALAPAARPEDAPGSATDASQSNRIDLPGIENARSQRLVLPTFAADAEPSPFRVSVEVDGAARELVLTPHAIRGPGFRVLVSDGDGGLRDVEPPPITTFRGHVAGLPESRVNASLTSAGLSAVIRLDANGAAHIVQPASVYATDPASAGVHVIYIGADMEAGDTRCGVITDDVGESADAGGGNERASLSAPSLVICEIGIDADFPFYELNGSSVAATVADIEWVLDPMSFVYERDVGIAYEITAIVVRTSVAEDPYSSNASGTLLCQFTQAWNTLPESTIHKDVGHLFTGRILLNGIIGLAQLGTVCNVAQGGCGAVQDRAYGLVRSRFSSNPDRRIHLSAHELGHNWNAVHCNGTANCHIMCSDTVGKCDGFLGENLKFGTLAMNQIEAFRDSRTCLVDAPDPVVPPFFDDFPANAINPANWTWSNPGSVIISANAMNEPSPRRSLQIRPLGSGPYESGEIRSNALLLGGFVDQFVTFAAQSHGVEAGETLVVDYRSSEPGWVTLETIVSSGIDEAFFSHYALPLPPDAHHDELRIRFRNTGDETNDLWYLDDVFVGPAAATPCPTDLDGDADTGFMDLLLMLFAWGPCPGSPGDPMCPGDVDGDGNVDFEDLLALLFAWGACP